ncbi:MAG: histidinol dehydrogenase [Clostridia bacterium]|nr:histidinol dehydrogenase [Clostridia bacterium]
MEIIDAKTLSTEQIIKREDIDTSDVEATVFEIVNSVRRDGDKALFAYTEKFDGTKLDCLEVSKEEIDEAYERVSDKLKNTLKLAKCNIEKFHTMQKRDNFEINGEGGTLVGQRITAIEMVGIYVPGGTASYPSTVLMNAIPATIAGVKEIVMVSPSDKNGKISDVILTAAKIAGVTRIFKIGGAQAVAALAYGTESVPKVDKIVGPGNIYVATAKKIVFGVVGIDMIAGPSEILIVADESAVAKYVAADLLSQAEHDMRASAILITTSKVLAQAVSVEVEKQLKKLPREEIARVSIDTNGKIILVNSLENAVDISNKIAPEHLELCVEKPFELLDKVLHAGSVFLGSYAPEALGDYFAGTNHTLPTSGTARFSSALSVDDFVKKTQYIYYPKTALEKVAQNIVEFAECEGLLAHGKSVAIRFEDSDKIR